jgi:hypothetical protein
VIDFGFHWDWGGFLREGGRKVRTKKGEDRGKRKRKSSEGELAGSSFWWGIALSGLPAKVQPHGLLEPGRRYVETSGDVICLGFMKLAGKSQYIFFQAKKIL